MRVNRNNAEFFTLKENTAELFEPYFDIFVDVKTVSPALADRISKAIEMAKMLHLDSIAQGGYFKPWSGNEEVSVCLHIVIENHTYTYEVCVNILDRENDYNDTSLCMELDLSEYEAEMKSLALNAVVKATM